MTGEWEPDHEERMEADHDRQMGAAMTGNQRCSAHTANQD